MKQEKSEVNHRIALGLLVAAVMAVAATLISRNGPPPKGASEGLNRGGELAASYCSLCHLAPDPGILTGQSWNVALAYMGFFLGVVDTSYLDDAPQIERDYVAATHGFLVQDAVLPGQRLIGADEWQALRKYYLDSAPESPLPQTDKPELSWALPQFRVVDSNYRVRPSVTTLVRINDAAQEAIVGDAVSRSLAVLGTDGQLASRPREFGPAMLPVDIEFRPDSAIVASIGDLFSVSRSEDRPGLIARIAPYSSGAFEGNTSVVIDGLYRLADMELADLNGDGVEDFIISGFGGSYGRVSWFESQDDGTFAEHVLIDRPGAVRAQVHDFNDDGFEDIAVLMSHAREGFYLLMNDGSNRFDAVTVFETHPAYGHTYFELQDFNDDGHMDILTVNGDNVDSDPYNTLRNYHGVRIYLNQGDLSFRQEFFYPMYGAFGARAADFDNDGDLDIAAISFYPDFESDERESFAYLQNDGDLSFRAYTSRELNRGRWMVLDAGDLDGDDDVDIILGAAYVPTGMLAHQDVLRELSENGPSVLLLENTGAAAPAD